MNSVITGASGYVGGILSRTFRLAGHQVLSLARRPCDPPWHRYALGDDPASIPWRDADILIHAAFDFTPRTWPDTLERNVKPSIAIIRAARDNGVRRTVFISSMSAFEGCRSLYGKAKLMIENEAAALGATVVRPGLVWGSRSGGVMGAIEKMAAALPIVPVLSGPGQLRQYLINEDDLATTVLRIAEAQDPPSFPALTLAHPTPLSLKEIIRRVSRRNGRTALTAPVPWALVMTALKTLETLGLNPAFRSDSLTGLVHSNPDPGRDSPFYDFAFQPFQ
jgi:nucleoside-diphosphate-sugar epimerase